MSGEWSVVPLVIVFGPGKGNLKKTSSRHGEIGVILYFAPYVLRLVFCAHFDLDVSKTYLYL